MAYLQPRMLRQTLASRLLVADVVEEVPVWRLQRCVAGRWCVEVCGGVWRCVEVCGGVWRCVEVCGGSSKHTAARSRRPLIKQAVLPPNPDQTSLRARAAAGCF